MTDEQEHALGVLVRVYRHGELSHEVRCENDQEAALTVAEWEGEDVRCEVVPENEEPAPLADEREREPSGSGWFDEGRENQ